MLTIPLPPKLEGRLRKRAAASGKDVAEFVAEAVEQKLTEHETLAEMLAPVHEAFRKSGMTEQKAMAAFQRARKRVREPIRRTSKAS